MTHPTLAGSMTLMPPAAASVLAFHLGISDNWPILLVGVALGLCAKAAVTTSSGIRYEWSYFRNDLLMAGFLVVASGFVVERWLANPPFPVTTYGELLLSMGLAVAGDRVRAIVAWAALGAAGRALGVPMASSPPSDLISPRNASNDARRELDARETPIAQFGARIGEEEARRARAIDPDQDKLDQLDRLG
ncbi:MAG: hypothetical protein ACRYG4_00540 [Janthinobacterium lividum]